MWGFKLCIWDDNRGKGLEGMILTTGLNPLAVYFRPIADVQA